MKDADGRSAYRPSREVGPSSSFLPCIANVKGSPQPPIITPLTGLRTPINPFSDPLSLFD
ncbi:hypothetical protein GCM10022284_56180 [Streptomyces hundungensis]